MADTRIPLPIRSADGGGDERNAYVFFRHTVVLDETPAEAIFHLFADTRYRLKVNGRLVGHGPCRFKRSRPFYDSYDLAAFLQKGENVLAVEVCTFARGTFLSDPGPCSLTAWGEVHTPNGANHSLAAGSHWRALRSPEHDPLTPELSFAVGPGEYRDTRSAPRGWDEPGYDDSHWPNARPVQEPDLGPLSPRPIALSDEREVSVERCLCAYAVAPEPESKRFGARIVGPKRAPGWAAAATWFYLESATTLTLGWADGELRINGRPVKPEGIPEAPYRGRADVELKAGWNKLCAFYAYRADMWELGLAYPRQAGLTFRRRPEADAPEGWMLAGPQTQDTTAARKVFENDGETLAPPALPGGWTPMPTKYLGLTPMVERGWSFLQPIENFPCHRVLDEPLAVENAAEGGALTLLFDFGGEVLGRPRIELSAQSGTTVDLGYTERVIDGQPHPWHQGTRMLERFIAAGGRQTIHAMHPRGMRYLELTVRNASSPVHLHAVGVTSALYPVERTGAFSCSEPLFERIWEVGRETKSLCMEDAYLDCPWRERGVYVGDMGVQYATNLACFGDHALLRHSLELVFRTQGADGLLAPCAHALPPGGLVDYTAWAVRILRDYWERSGDLDYVRAMESFARGAVEGLLNLRETESPLIDAGNRSVYLDRSIVDKQGVNCGLNCLILGAVRDFAHLSRQLGDLAEAERRENQASALAAAIREAFLDPDSGCFLDRRRTDRPDTTPSAVGNILALHEGLAESSEKERPLRFVESKMRDNFEVDPPRRTNHNHISPFMSHYLFLMLEQEGRVDAIDAYIRKYWSYLLEDGMWTFREFFPPIASLCHAWSTAPVSHFMRSVLGLWPGVDGDPDKVRFAPNPPASLERAEGVLPHPKGPVKASWYRDGSGEIRATCEAPEGVTIESAFAFSS